MKGVRDGLLGLLLDPLEEDSQKDETDHDDDDHLNGREKPLVRRGEGKGEEETSDVCHDDHL
jgi:hypothetical protein